MKVMYRCVQLSWYKYLLLYCPILLCENVLLRISAIVLNCTAVCSCLVVLYCTVQLCAAVLVQVQYLLLYSTVLLDVAILL
jgi:hypothetical protein